MGIHGKLSTFRTKIQADGLSIQMRHHCIQIGANETSMNDREALTQESLRFLNGFPDSDILIVLSDHSTDLGEVLVGMDGTGNYLSASVEKVMSTVQPCI